MTASLSHEATFLEHEGGTKFYEIVRLYNADAGKFVLVKRWGKIAQRIRGGEIKIEDYRSARAVDLAADKTAREKMSRGYSLAKTDTAGALHNRSGSYTSEMEFGGALAAHYGPNATRIGQAITGKVLDESVAEEENEIVVLEPEPEPDRGNTWGSW